MSQPEPWLRGTLTGLPPATAHLFYTFEQAREELPFYCTDLADIWKEPAEGIAPVGFHLRHIAGSVDRLTTYLLGRQLDGSQLASLRQESAAGIGFVSLMEAIEAQFRKTEAIVRAIPASTFEEPRSVGRKQLPTTAGGLIVHMSEHTQRHLGQAVVVARIQKALFHVDSER